MAKDKKRNSKSEKNKFVSKDAEISLLGLLIFILSLICIGKQGPIAGIITYALIYLTGMVYIFILLLFLVFGLFLFLRRRMPIISLGLYSSITLVLFIFIMIYASDSSPSLGGAFKAYNLRFEQVSDGRFHLVDDLSLASLGGGLIGFMTFGLLKTIATDIGARIICLVGIIFCGAVIARPIIKNVYKFLNSINLKLPEIKFNFKGSQKDDDGDSIDQILTPVDNQPQMGMPEVNFKIKDQKTSIVDPLTEIENAGKIKNEIKAQKQEETKGSQFNLFKDELYQTKSNKIDFEDKKSNKYFSFDIFNYNEETTSNEEENYNASFNRPTSLNSHNESDSTFQQKEEIEIPKEDPTIASTPLFVTPEITKAQPKFKVKTSGYVIPSISMLEDHVNNKNGEKLYEEAARKVQVLNETFTQFKIKADVSNYTIGPSVTRFEIRPDIGVRVSAIANIQNDIMFATAAPSIRIEAPIPGKSAVGIEIPNQFRMMVGFKEVLSAFPSSEYKEKLLVAIGKDIDGTPIFIKLNKMPHLLVAGATGSGKSVCMNTIIASLLMRTRPDEVKLMLIDPKKVEMIIYNQIPHLLCPVINDAKLAAVGLSRIVNEMDARYQLLSQHAAKNIEQYNSNCEEKGYPKLPYIVVIIDELADLMYAASKEVELYIQRITQLARSAGIHLIVATQRPSVNIITGVIKANIPSRIAFAVANQYDSKTILDTAGAEQLLGMGDMLLSVTGELNIKRVQGAYVSDDEINSIVKFICAQMAPQYDPNFLNLEPPPAEEPIVTRGEDSNEETLYQDIKRFVIESQRASTSILQRYFNIGYSRAARILDQLEAEGIVGLQVGTKPRDVLVKKEDLK